MYEPMTNGTEPTSEEAPEVEESRVLFTSNGPTFTQEAKFPF
jgi:hypothetical protein